MIVCKLKRFDFENALRDVENWRLERLTDFLLDLPPFVNWTRKQARKLLQSVKFEKVLKGWERQRNGVGATEKPNTNAPDGARFFMVLDGEFEYETVDKETIKIRKSGGGLGRKEFDVRKLLFQRKKVTIDDRRRVQVTEDLREKMIQDNRITVLFKNFKPQTLLLEKGQFFGEEALIQDDRC